MKVGQHSVIRTRPEMAALASIGREESASSATLSALPLDSYTAGGAILDNDMPDISGFANYSKGKLLAVRDSKLESKDARILSMDKKDGKLSPLNIDWSRTGVARDLEAITSAGGKKGGFLAVEGSSFGEHKARLFEMSIQGDTGRAEKSHVLPQFGQEIEGIVALKGSKEGHQTVLLAGRGGDGQKGRIYWGDLSEQGLSFSEEGMKGQAVEAPFVGEGQRDLSELSLDDKGNLWGIATVDNGNSAPFESSLYRVGSLGGSSSAPFSLKMGESFKLKHIKAEALAMQDNRTAFIGSDNESLGGSFDSVLF